MGDTPSDGTGEYARQLFARDVRRLLGAHDDPSKPVVFLVGDLVSQLAERDRRIEELDLYLAVAREDLAAEIARAESAERERDEYRTTFAMLRPMVTNDERASALLVCRLVAQSIGAWQRGLRELAEAERERDELRQSMPVICAGCGKREWPQAVARCESCVKAVVRNARESAESRAAEAEGRVEQYRDAVGHMLIEHHVQSGSIQHFVLRAVLDCFDEIDSALGATRPTPTEERAPEPADEERS